MKKNYHLLFSFIVLIALISCNKKKLTEVVEVPLPSAEEKITMGVPNDVTADEGTFLLQKIWYLYDELNPSISPLTLEMHYSKHYLTYTNNLNKAIVGTELEGLTIEEVLAKLDTSIPEIKNNAGGYYNHSLYFDCLSPKGGGKPKDTLANAITKKFGSFEEFTKSFKDEATKQFGSAWVWLVVDSSGELQITSTQNQDNPLMRNAAIKGTPILALDLWEHAYYIDYQYKRKLYVDAFFKVINWKKVNENYLAAIEKE